MWEEIYAIKHILQLNPKTIKLSSCEKTKQNAAAAESH
jgi:hypothetical protein